MKTNLLKIAGGVCFSLALLTAANVSAQTKAYDNFEYPVGATYQGVEGSGLGWAGPWDGTQEGPGNGGGFHDIIAGNLEGTIGATGTQGGQWTSSFRDLADPFTNTVGNVVWVGFTYRNNRPGKGGGSAFFWGANENLYLGSLPGDFAGIGNCHQDPLCLDPIADAPGITLTTDAAHYYLIKITGQGNDIIKADFWVDYLGTTEPLANFSELTYGNSGYRQFAAGIDKIRISGDTEPSEGTTMYSTFDAVRIGTDFFVKDDLILAGNLSLEDEVAAAKAKVSNSSFFPNPVTNGSFTVKANKESLKSVSILDLSGKKVLSQAVSLTGDKVNTSSLAKGVYILEVKGSKTTSRNKLVID